MFPPFCISTQSLLFSDLIYCIYLQIFTFNIGLWKLKTSTSTIFQNENNYIICILLCQYEKIILIGDI